MLRAIVLAAGTASRLSARTAGGAKCLLDLHGRPLLHRQIALLRGAGVDDIVVVTGHDGERVRAALPPRVTSAHYDRYAETNNLGTLAAHAALLDVEPSGAVLIVFADVLVTASALARLVAATTPVALLVDMHARRPGTMRVRLDEASVMDVGPHIPVAEGDGNFVGLARLSAVGAATVAAEVVALAASGEHNDDYWTAALPRLSARGQSVQGIDVAGDPWLEVDTPADLDAARSTSFYVARLG